MKSVTNNEPDSLACIHSLWIGDRLSPIERLTALSFMRHGHKFVLYVYREVQDVPSGVELRDANKVIPLGEVFLSHGSYAHFSDWFRWKLLRMNGGVWVDMDVVCLRPIDLNIDIMFGFESVNLPNVSVLGFPAGHPVCEAMEDRCMNPNHVREGDSAREIIRKLGRRYLHGNQRGSVKWGEAGGPSGFKRVLDNHAMLKKGLPFTYFYPIHWTNAAAIFDDSLSQDIKMFSDTRCIHLWNDQLRKHGINKFGPFPKASLINKLLYLNGV